MQDTGCRQLGARPCSLLPSPRKGWGREPESGAMSRYNGGSRFPKRRVRSGLGCMGNLSRSCICPANTVFKRSCVLGMLVLERRMRGIRLRRRGLSPCLIG